MNTESTTGRVLRPRAAANYLGMGLTSLWGCVKSGILPPPIAITGTAKGFPIEDLDSFVEARKAEREAAHG